MRYEWDDTALQTQDSKFEPWRSEAELATSRSRRLPTIFNLYGWAGKKHFVSLKLECQSCLKRLCEANCITGSKALGPLPANTTHLSNVWPMLAHRLRRWPKIGQTLDRCVVFDGLRMSNGASLAMFPLPWILTSPASGPFGIIAPLSVPRCASSLPADALLERPPTDLHH